VSVVKMWHRLMAVPKPLIMDWTF